MVASILASEVSDSDWNTRKKL